MARSLDELQQQLTRLEAENTTLRAEVAAADRPAEVVSGGAPIRKRAWGRTLLATVLILIGALIAPVAVVAAWANVQLTDTDRFVTSYAPLANEPAVQSLVTAQVVSVIEQQVDIPTLTSDVIDGVIDLGTGPAATRALELLKGPAAQGLQSLVATLIERFVESDAFANVWASALRVSHSQLVAALQNDPDAAIALGQDGTIGIQLAPIIDAVKDALVEQGVGFAASIPTVDRTIIVAQTDSLASVQLAYGLVVAGGLWLPWITLLLLAAGVIAARRRFVALITASLSLAATMVILIAGIAVGRVFFDAALRSGTISADAGGVIYERVVGAMRDTSVAVLVLALATAAVAWFTGPFDIPRRMRGAVRAGAGTIRAALERRGVTTGRVGGWMYSQRVLLRVVLAVVSAAIVLLVRPLTPALTLWTLALSLLVALVLEIIERPPTDRVDGVTPDREALSSV